MNLAEESNLQLRNCIEICIYLVSNDSSKSGRHVNLEAHQVISLVEFLDWLCSHYTCVAASERIQVVPSMSRSKVYM